MYIYIYIYPLILLTNNRRGISISFECSISKERSFEKLLGARR